MIGAFTVFAAIGAVLLRCDVAPATGTTEVTSRLEVPAMIQEGSRHPSLPVLYLACTDHDTDEHSVVPVVIGPESMTVGAAAPLPARAVQLSLDPAGRHLLAIHTREPSLTVLPVDGVGGLGEPAATPLVAFADYLHDAQVSPDGTRAVIVARGHTGRTGTPALAGRIHLADYDDGLLTEIDDIGLGSAFPNVGFNPRNVAFHPTLPLIYVSLEAQNLILTLSLVDDRLTLLPERTRQLLDHPDDARARQLAGVLVVHPERDVLYAVTRADGPIVDNDRWRTPENLPIFEGGENTLSVFDIGAEGQLTLAQRIDTGGISARCVELTGDGTLLVVANGKPILTGDESEPDFVPASLSAFEVDGSGHLAPLSRTPYEVGRETLWWVG